MANLPQDVTVEERVISFRTPVDFKKAVDKARIDAGETMQQAGIRAFAAYFALAIPEPYLRPGDVPPQSASVANWKQQKQQQQNEGTDADAPGPDTKTEAGDEGSDDEGAGEE